MLRKQINGTTLRGTDGIDRTLNAVTLSEDEKKKVGELDFLPNDVLLADGVKAVAANDKVGLTEKEVREGLAEGKWLPIREGTGKSGFGNGSIVESNAMLTTGSNAHAEGYLTTAEGNYSHAEGESTTTTTRAEHAEGRHNYSEKNMFISTIGVGNYIDKRNAVAVSVSGELFLINTGGYEGKSKGDAKSVQILLQSYESRITALETKIEELENANKSE